MLNKFFKLFVGISLVISIAACNTYPDGPIISTKSKAERIANTWKVVKATDSDGEDKTSSFENYTYTFGEDSTAEVTYTIASIDFKLKGTWELLRDETIFHLDVKDVTTLIKIDQEFLINRLTKDEFWLEEKDNSSAILELGTLE